jgi:hypothetical protein
MTQTIRARYHGGKLEPLEPLEVEEGKEVTITVIDAEPSVTVGHPPPGTAGSWAGNVPDDFEETVAADRRLASPREEPTW